MHQPYYKDSRTGDYILPWVRLHAVKDYLHMAEVLAQHPGVHVVLGGDFTAEIEGVAIRTTAGLAYRIEHRAMRLFSVIDPEKDQGDLFLGPPNITDSIDRIAGNRLVGKNPGPCRVASPWVEGLRARGDTIVDRGKRIARRNR